MAKRLPLNLIKNSALSDSSSLDHLLGEAQLGRQERAEGKLRCYLSLLDLYFGADQSAGSETQQVAVAKRSETQNSSTIQI